MDGDEPAAPVPTPQVPPPGSAVLAPAAPAAAPAQAVSTPVPVAGAAAPATAPEAPAPLPQPPVATPAPGAPAAAPAPVAQDAQAAFTAWRTNAESELAKGHFALPKEVAELAESDPVKFAQETLPALAAKVYLDTVTAAVSAIQAALPNAIDGLLNSRTAESKAEDEFFSAWPQIDRQAHKSAVLEIGRTYRAMNPQATKDDYIKNVGALAALRLGLPLQVAAPAASAAPAVRPHVPLAVSAPRAAAAPVPNGNIFASPMLDLSQHADDE